MNKDNIHTAFKRWYQINSPSHKSAAGLISDHLSAVTLICRCTMVRCSQSVGAALLAGGLYLISNWSGDGVRLLAVLAATSALVYIGLAIESRTGAMALLNLLAVPVLFATAYASLNVASEWLIVSYILQGCVTSVQIESSDKDLCGALFSWSAFSSVMALLLLLGPPLG